MYAAIRLCTWDQLSSTPGYLQQLLVLLLQAIHTGVSGHTTMGPVTSLLAGIAFALGNSAVTMCTYRPHYAYALLGTRCSGASRTTFELQLGRRGNRLLRAPPILPTEDPTKTDQTSILLCLHQA